MRWNTGLNFLGGIQVVADVGAGAGLVGHLREEAKNPMAWEVKMRADEEAAAHIRK